MIEKNINKKIDKQDDRKYKLIISACVVGGLIISNIFTGCFGKGTHSHDAHKGTEVSTKDMIKYWTCSMHPQIKLPQKGLCPICAMDLVPVKEGEEDHDEGAQVSLTLNDSAQKLAEIATAVVTYQEVFNEVRLVGKVDYDETKLSYISAWVPGRIDRLFVDFTGTRVREGDHLIKLYSPELLATQQEYLQALKNIEDTKESQLSVFRDTAQSTLNSVKEKLRLYGITDEQIKEIVQRGTPEEHMIIYSPVKGTVIHKNGFEGMYVKTGDKIYTISDLSKVWLFLEAYESDIQWLHYGQDVDIETESYPGEIFHGKVAFIDPFVNEKTRTIKLRVNVDNRGEKLKPGMFVRARIKAVLGDGGKVYEEDLAGKWICPMHPDVIKDNQEQCDICEMDLIRTSEFGFAEQPTVQKKVLVVPKTAPLITGKRAVVYVENDTKKNTTKRYEGREIVLGPRAGKNYIVLSGLEEGERVVVKGNFKIDSALQIQAKPSMMSPGQYYSETDNILSQSVPVYKGSADVLKTALSYYLATTSYLAQDDVHMAADNLDKFKNEIIKTIQENSSISNDEGIVVELNLIQKKLGKIDHDIDSLRIQFGEVSNILQDIFDKYEYTEDLKLYLSF